MNTIQKSPSGAVSDRNSSDGRLIEIPAVVSGQSFQRLDSHGLVQAIIEPCSKACLTHFTIGVATHRNDLQPSRREHPTQTTSEDESIHPRQGEVQDREFGLKGCRKRQGAVAILRDGDLVTPRADETGQRRVV